MKTLRLSLLLFSGTFLLLSSQCKKSDSSPPLTELQKLPPITQGGRNTFGCLINGKAFVPGGGGILANTFTVQYDPTFQGGKLGITAKYYPDATNFITVSLGGDSINTVGNYYLTLHSRFHVAFFDSKIPCDFQTYYDVPNSGVLYITRFDNVARVISGTFSFNVTKPCGITDITDGRFDVTY